jgi:hypothetical protein
VNRIGSIYGHFDRVRNVFFNGYRHVFFNMNGIRLRYWNWNAVLDGYTYFVRHVFLYGNRIGMRYLYVNGIRNLFLDMNVIRYGYFFGNCNFFNVRMKWCRMMWYRGRRYDRYRTAVYFIVR